MGEKLRPCVIAPLVGVYSLTVGGHKNDKGELKLFFFLGGGGRFP